jgi:4-amino-4-deoxy-L-arabinose transferase-like glycosyltransferase
MQVREESKTITSENTTVSRERLENVIARGEKAVSTLWGNSSFRFWLALLLVSVLMFGLRAYHLGKSYDIFIDEVTYLKISQSVASTLQVQLYNKPFFLHPPAFFFIEAAYLKLLQPDGSIIQNVYSVRWINVFFSSLAGVLLFLIAYRAKGWLSAVVVAVLFGLNPFVIRISSLNLLEASAMAFIVAGYWVLVSAMHDPDIPWSPIWNTEGFRKLFTRKRFIKEWPKKRRVNKNGSQIQEITIAAVPASQVQVAPIALWQLALAGFFFGMALLIKETTAFLTILPLVVCFLLKWVMERRAAVITGLVSVVVYSFYPLVVILSGNWAMYSQQKFRGILRFLGMVQITGFNRSGGPSLSETIINRLGVYGTTYLLLALGTIAVLVLLSDRGRISRLVGIFAACAYAMMAYLIFLGTLEEQYFIYLAVPSILACGIAIGSIKQSLLFERFRRTILIVSVCAALLFTGWDSYQWINTHTRPDNTYEQLMAYLHTHVPGGERVASNSETGQYILTGYLSGPWGDWHTVDELKLHKPEYLVWTPDTVAWNFGDDAQALSTWVEQHGKLVFQATGRQGNKTQLYHLDWITGK